MSVCLTSDMDSPASMPYFLWDEPMTVAELKWRLSQSTTESRRLLAKILREARDTDVWKFTTPQEVARRFDELSPYLGRRRVFWEFLLKGWKEEGLLDAE